MGTWLTIGFLIGIWGIYQYDQKNKPHLIHLFIVIFFAYLFVLIITMFAWPLVILYELV